ncbi:hypothetical protein UFOVP1305_35 [uncultured Caudovirales phage]|uniref:Holin n=1 Tax=uncultured Caudovirales phage TaxID=2100421 RepID=A0A6J5RW42_9CAUD|nr:hypothetical protein UFOVP896_73 [uncultured Caudovirales phage]CAB4197821.1 hypothetical protein UFOVP1305_35 [uncultured Caudovirales phage]
MFYRLLIERALRSAFASFTAVIATALLSSDLSVSTIRATLIAAGAAAVSAVITMLSQFVGDPTSTSFFKSAPGSSQ